MGIRCADHVTPLYQLKLALTSPTGGGRSVGIVRSRTKTTEFFDDGFFIHIKQNAHFVVTYYECDCFSLHSLSFSYTEKAMNNIADALHCNRPKQPETLRRKELSPSTTRKGKQDTNSHTFIINMHIHSITSSCAPVLREFGQCTQHE